MDLMKRNKVVCMFEIVLCTVVVLFMQRLEVSAQEMDPQNPAQNSVSEFEFTGEIQSFTAPVSGIYFIEAWGAQGGAEGGTGGGTGGYVSGYKKMQGGENIYICVGGQSLDINGGYNGGGNGNTVVDLAKEYKYTGAGGGGCTSITTSDHGTLDQFATHQSDILLVASGGGGSHQETPTVNPTFIEHKSQGSNGGGISTEGNTAFKVCYIRAGSGKTEWEEKATVKTVNQETGFAFGKGQSGGSEIGSGGGGLYGGYAELLEHDIKSGGGGSSYIDGLPTFQIGEKIYKNRVVSGARMGNGAARITFIEYDLTLTLENSADSKYEDQDSTMILFTTGVVSYEWQKQKKKDKTAPLEEDWETLIMDGSHYKTEKKSDPYGITRIQLKIKAKMEDHDSWFRLKAVGNDNRVCVSDLFYFQVTKLMLTEVKAEYTEIIEVGDTLPISKIKAFGIFNNPDVQIDLQSVKEYQNQLFYIQNKKLYREFLFSTVDDKFPLFIHFNHEDNPKDGKIFFCVTDTTAPVIKGVSAAYIKLDGNNPQTIRIIIDAVDKADGQLEYWITREGTDGEIQKNNTFDLIFSQNESIVIHVRDEMGNQTDYPYDVIFRDVLEPEIQEITATPDKWTKEGVVINVKASDLRSGLADRAYSFDNGISWIKESSCEFYENKRITILVRDREDNTAAAQYEIHHIDREAPWIGEITTDPESNWVRGTAVVTVSAGDAGAGLHDMAFSFDSGATWGNINKLELEDTSEIHVMVRDQLENIREVIFQVKKYTLADIIHDILAPEAGDTSEKRPTIFEVIEVPVTEAKFAASNPKTVHHAQLVSNADVVDTRGDNAMEEGKDNTSVRSDLQEQSKEDSMPLSEEKPSTKQKKLPPIVPIATCATGTTGIMGFLWFIILKKCEVYSVNEENEEEYYSSYFLHKTDRYYIDLKEYANNFEKGKNLLKCSKWFINKNRGKMIQVCFYDFDMELIISDVMKF